MFPPQPATWERGESFRAGFVERQRCRGLASGKARRAKAAGRRQLLLDFPGFSSHAIARITGIPRTTVRRLRKQASVR
jgi:hypothetical protein